MKRIGSRMEERNTDEMVLLSRKLHVKLCRAFYLQQKVKVKFQTWLCGYITCFSSSQATAQHLICRHWDNKVNVFETMKFHCDLWHIVFYDDDDDPHVIVHIITYVSKHTHLQNGIKISRLQLQVGIQQSSTNQTTSQPLWCISDHIYWSYSIY